MRHLPAIACALLLSIPAAALPGTVLDPDLSFDQRHAACLELIADDAEMAFETAITWKGRGGGHRARHCEAMSLWALGQEREAAARLDALAEAFPTDAGYTVNQWRLDYRTAAAQSWLQGGEFDRAYASATAALDADPSDPEARITRARAYFALDRVRDAETDLTSLLSFHPEHAEALRYRADARLRLGELDAALRDIEDSLAHEATVDSALVRGHILEAIRKEDAIP